MSSIANPDLVSQAAPPSATTSPKEDAHEHNPTRKTPLPKQDISKAVGMTSPQDTDNPCRIQGIRLTREQCRKRQLGNWRYSKGRNGRGKPALNPMFITCRWNEPDRQFCSWWIPDLEYFQQSTLERQYPWLATLEQLEEALLDV